MKKGLFQSDIIPLQQKNITLVYCGQLGAQVLPQLLFFYGMSFYGFIQHTLFGLKNIWLRKKCLRKAINLPYSILYVVNLVRSVIKFTY